ncbi:MAG: RidA family protein [Candidatus Micrarchaeota archaeon]
MKKVVMTDKAPAPLPGAPYSQAIKADGLVFCSGQLPIDPKTGKFASEGIEGQTKQVLTNLQAVLEASGSSLQKVVKTTVLLSDLGDFGAMNSIYSEFFKKDPPARTTFQAGKLPMNAKIEIDAIALC